MDTTRAGMDDAAFGTLASELEALFARGVDAPLDDDAFDALVARAFGWQFEHNRAYRGFAEGRGAMPGTVARWTDLPAVPATAFKHLSLLSGEPAAVEAVFRTSGTTRGGERRGEHPVPRLSLYRASALPNFRDHVLPDGARLPLVSLIPRPSEAPDSSLSAMMGFVADALCAPEGGGWFVEAGGRIRQAALSEALGAAEADGRPVLVAGTAFAFVHWLDAMAGEGRRFRLPDGSRVMETGGFKGRSRAMPREDLYRGLVERLGVPARRIVNEYGMTELLSQFYEPVMREGRGGDPSARRHVPPPWVRTRVLDPVTLEPVADGEAGLLQHVDLANLGSVCAVLTEDRGVRVGDGFRVLGRVEGAEPRGCSRAMDELLSGAP
ncbi:MAG: long-chain fatty acid--CoA ligase [Gemmatimonadetes bacterium]|nr:long-chain fatty acid--CoA ligase [Gemmatimonadota bacterium]